MTKKIIMLIDVEEGKLFTTVNDLYDRMQGYNTRLINMPQKKEITDAMVWNSKYESETSYYGGYNACIDEILGEE